MLIDVYLFFKIGSRMTHFGLPCLVQVTTHCSEFAFMRYSADSTASRPFGASSLTAIVSPRGQSENYTIVQRECEECTADSLMAVDCNDGCPRSE
jgi:hypothetical protein